MSSSRQTLNALITECLGEAASDICVEVKELLAPLEEQNQQSRKELERLNRLLASVTPNIKVDTTDTMEIVSRRPGSLKEEPQHPQPREETRHTPME